MPLNPSKSSRQDRQEGTKLAIAEILHIRISGRRFRQMSIVRASGISRSHLRSVLRAEKQLSLFIFMELSEALGFDDPCQLLRAVLDRREQCVRERTEETCRDE